jgi:hypothetical protein
MQDRAHALTSPIHGFGRGRSNERRKRSFLTWRGIPRKHATYITHIQDEDERERERERERKERRREKRETER